jgi:TIR domain/WD domain, G-beta repeat
MSANGFGFDVFLSHSSKDKATVRLIAERLRAGGLRVWLDEWEIRPGDSIPAKIEEGLEQSAVLILCMSANSLGSDWATVESQTFRFRDPLNRKRRFIPVRLDETELRGSLRQFAYVDWCDGGSDEAYARLLSACKPPEARSVLHRDGSPVPRREVQIPLNLAEPESAPKPAPHNCETEPQQPHTQSGRGWNAPRALVGHRRPVCALALSADGRRAAARWDDKNICVWDLEGDATPRVLDGHFNSVRSVALSADGLRVACGADDRSMRVWDLEDNKPLHSPKWHRGLVLSVALSADGNRAVCGSNDHDVYFWNLDSNSGGQVRTWHKGPVLAVAMSANGKRALSGSDDETVLVWDLESRESPRMLEGQSGAVLSVALSANGKCAISGSIDSAVRVWDLDGKVPPRVLEGHSAPSWQWH